MNNSDPIAYEVVATLQTVTVTKVNQKVVIKLNKTLANETTASAEPFIGFKLHNEASWTADHFIAVRCAVASASCAVLPIECVRRPLNRDITPYIQFLST